MSTSYFVLSWNSFLPDGFHEQYMYFMYCSSSMFPVHPVWILGEQAISSPWLCLSGVSLQPSNQFCDHLFLNDDFILFSFFLIIVSFLKCIITVFVLLIIVYQEISIFIFTVLQNWGYILGLSVCVPLSVCQCFVWMCWVVLLFLALLLSLVNSLCGSILFLLLYHLFLYVCLFSPRVNFIISPCSVLCHFLIFSIFPSVQLTC